MPVEDTRLVSCLCVGHGQVHLDFGVFRRAKLQHLGGDFFARLELSIHELTLDETAYEARRKVRQVAEQRYPRSHVLLAPDPVKYFLIRLFNHRVSGHKNWFYVEFPAPLDHQ